MIQRIEMDLAGRPLAIETGRMAKQASGAVLASYENTLVFPTAVASHIAKAGIDFLPLTVNYRGKPMRPGKFTTAISSGKVRSESPLLDRRWKPPCGRLPKTPDIRDRWLQAKSPRRTLERALMPWLSHSSTSSLRGSSIRRQSPAVPSSMPAARQGCCSRPT